MTRQFDCKLDILKNNDEYINYKQLKNFQKKIRVRLTLCLFIKKEAQTRVSRIGNSVHYNDYPYKYSNVNCNDVNDNDYTKLK